MTAPFAVASRFPGAAGLTWVPLGSGGGFSGASVWRGEAAGQPVAALKAWPPGFPVDRLTRIHGHMSVARDAGLGFVPRVFAAADGATAIEHAGRVWDAVAWMPGAADFHGAPTDLRLTAACAAVAGLHRAWRGVPAVGRFPAVARRLELLRGWVAFHQPDALARVRGSPSLARRAGEERETLGRAVDALRSSVPGAVADLLPLADRSVELQPCLCDVWHDHVQFTGDAVSGVIDYGAMKVDHPAVDLARLLGDLVGDEPERVRFGVEAYRQAGGSPAVTVELVELLDRTGLVGAVVNWVRRLTDRAAPPADPTAATARLGRLLDRLDRVGRSAGR